MVDVILKTPDGDKVGNSSPVPTVRKVDDAAVRRVGIVDLDGPVGEFLSQALCFLAPNSFGAGNWKGKLSTFITSKTTSFVCCGRAVGLATLIQDTMSGTGEAVGLFVLAAEGGTEEDVVEVLRTHKQWARDLGVGYRPPLKEYSSLSQSKMQVALKAEKREELFVPPLSKK